MALFASNTPVQCSQSWVPILALTNRPFDITEWTTSVLSLCCSFNLESSPGVTRKRTRIDSHLCVVKQQHRSRYWFGVPMSFWHRVASESSVGILQSNQSECNTRIGAYSLARRTKNAINSWCWNKFCELTMFVRKLFQRITISTTMKKRNIFVVNESPIVSYGKINKWNTMRGGLSKSVIFQETLDGHGVGRWYGWICILASSRRNIYNDITSEI